MEELGWEQLFLAIATDNIRPTLWSWFTCLSQAEYNYPIPIHPKFHPGSSRLVRLLLLLRMGVGAYQMHFWRSSLVVHWFGLCASTAGVQFRFLVEELRSCMPHGTAGKKCTFCIYWDFYDFLLCFIDDKYIDFVYQTKFMLQESVQIGGDMLTFSYIGVFGVLIFWWGFLF